MNSENPNAAFTGSIPANYDKYLGPLLFEFSGDDMARRVSSKPGGGGRILEVACGTGISTRHLADKTPPGTEIVATDLNPAMLEHAIAMIGTPDGVSWQQADALSLPFGDAEFDAVVCQFGVMFFPDRAAGFAEMARVLKPGGCLTVTTWDSFEFNPAVEVVDRVIKGFFETDPPRFLEMPFDQYDPEGVKALFHAAGLQNVEVTYVSATIETADYSLVARGFITGTPIVTEVEKRGTVKVSTLISAASQALEARFGAAPAGLPFREITFQSVKPGA